MELTESRTVAFIDLGTNSARLMVVKLNPNYSYAVLTRQKEAVRLGEGEFAENLLTTPAIERTVAVVSGMAEIARSFSSVEIIAVATSATRDARNRDDLIHRVREEAGVEIKVISGPEEARLIWLGVSSGVDIDSEKCLFIDIGGGSTEIIVGDQRKAHLLRSLKLGAIRTTNLFIPPDLTGPVPDPVIQMIRKDIRGRASHTVRNIKEFTIQQAFGSSGTISSLEAIVASQKNPLLPHQPGIITIQELRSVVQLLCSLSLHDRRSVNGINPDRADIIVVGGLILETLLELTGITSIQVSSRSLRDGMLVDYLSRIPGFPHAQPMSVRDSSIRLLGRSCHIDESHADHVSCLALSLFDSAKAANLHNLPESAREILLYATYLHDAGQFISFSGHHQHSYYVIMHAPLLGFVEEEILMIALVARYHRKKMPRSKDPGYAQLDNESKQTVKILAQLLRMAENLDRSHDGRVQSASLSSSDQRNAMLSINCRTDCTLEQWAILGDLKSFEQTFARTLLIHISPQNNSSSLPACVKKL
jgi:exopolyphosphatase/guanosine-5'-triphosphate,3'-diphosphate pyrophosphatase